MLIKSNAIEVAITVECQDGRCDLFGFDELQIELNRRVDSWVTGQQAKRFTIGNASEPHRA